MSYRLEQFLWMDLLLVIVLAPLAFGTVEDWSIALFELNAVLAAVVLAFVWLLRPDGFKLSRWRMAAPLAVLTSFNIAQGWVPNGTLDVAATRQSAFKLLALLIYWLVALHLLRSSARRRQLLYGLSALGAGLAVFAIAQKLTYNGRLYWVRPVSPYVAPFGPYVNYNHFAGAMELLLPLPFAWWLLARAEISQRLLAFWAAVVMMVALVYSLSRGGLLALGVQLIVLLAVVWRERARAPQRLKRRNTPILIGVALIISLALALALAADQLAARFQLMQQGGQEYSVVTRRAYWAASWQMFLAHPWTGVGLGAFPTAYPQFGRSSARLERLETAHNDYLQLLTDAGLMGAALLLWLLVEIARQLRHTFSHWPALRSPDRAATLGSGLAVLGIAVHSFVDFNLQITANALLCVIALSLTVAATEAAPAAKSLAPSH